MLLDFVRTNQTKLQFVERPNVDGLWYLLPDDLLPTEYRKPRPNDTQGWPQTVNATTVRETIPMTEKIQRWLFALNAGLPVGNFADTFDTWNTGSKVRDSANFITGERLDRDLPKYPTNLLFGCNVVKQKRLFAWPGGSGISVGTSVIEIETIDPNYLPFISYKTYPWLVQHLTIIHPSIYDDRQRVNPFPQNGGRNGNPCYTGILATEPIYIEAARCRKVSAIPSVYNPVWNWNK